MVLLLLFSECVAPVGLAWDARRVGVDNDDAIGSFVVCSMQLSIWNSVSTQSSAENLSNEMACAERTGWSARVTFDGVVHADDVVGFGGVLALLDLLPALCKDEQTKHSYFLSLCPEGVSATNQTWGTTCLFTFSAKVAASTLTAWDSRFFLSF